jgi:hypothetical protein
MFARLHTPPLNIAYRLNLLISALLSCVLQLTQRSNIVIPPIRFTIHTLTIANLFHLLLQSLQPITMLSTAQQPNHTTIKLALYVQPALLQRAVSIKPQAAQNIAAISADKSTNILLVRCNMIPSSIALLLITITTASSTIVHLKSQFLLVHL